MFDYSLSVSSQPVKPPWSSKRFNKQHRFLIDTFQMEWHPVNTFGNQNNNMPQYKLKFKRTIN